MSDKLSFLEYFKFVPIFGLGIKNIFVQGSKNSLDWTIHRELSAVTLTRPQVAEHKVAIVAARLLQYGVRSGQVNSALFLQVEALGFICVYWYHIRV